MKSWMFVIAAGLAVAAAHAQTPAAPAAPAPATATAAMNDGEVRKIDKAQSKLTLRHGPLASLDMPAMTMVFRVADAKLLDGLKEGDKVRFSADRIDGAYTVTAIQPAAK